MIDILIQRIPGTLKTCRKYLIGFSFIYCRNRNQTCSVWYATWHLLSKIHWNDTWEHFMMKMLDQVVMVITWTVSNANTGNKSVTKKKPGPKKKNSHSFPTSVDVTATTELLAGQDTMRCTICCSQYPPENIEWIECVNCSGWSHKLCGNFQQGMCYLCQ